MVLMAVTLADQAVADPATPDTSPLKQTPSKKASSDPSSSEKSAPDTMTMSVFLDRLMLAESSGRDDARNPRSTATGAFQFIDSTWLSLMSRHFAERTQSLNRQQVLALRTDRELAREAAEIYTKENAAVLVADGHKPTFPNLRLAFLLGAGGASRVLALAPNARVAPIVGSAVVRANPFMARLTAKQLRQRAARDLRITADKHAALATSEIAKPSRGAAGQRRQRKPRIVVKCNLGLASCRRWLALKKRQLRRGGAKRIRAARRRRSRRH